MKKRSKEKFIIGCMAFFTIITLITIFIIFISFSQQVFKAPSTSVTALVSFEIEDFPIINITSPLPTIYNFNASDTLILDLNATTNFEADSFTWQYTLVDLRHGEIKWSNVTFSPNTTFIPVRWDNVLYVSVLHNITRKEISANVSFYVNVSNTAPLLGPINSSIFVCENTALSYDFNATDPDENLLSLQINPQDPFFVNPDSFNLKVDVFSSIISGVLNKSHSGGIGAGFLSYIENISVNDNYNSTCCVDTAVTNITVIEVNNLVEIEPSSPISSVGAQTVWTQGQNSTFYHEEDVLDLEDGNSTGGNLIFNLTILNSTGDLVNLFNVSPVGVMNFTANNNTPLGVYNVSLCAEDKGISNPFSRILIECGQTGGPLRNCDNFSLTVTDINRPPTIIDNYPSNLTLSVSGEQPLFFNITKFDPDGTIPDAYWYVDGVFAEYDAGHSVDNFSYTFPCEMSGTHIIKAEITDGLLNDSINWNIDVDSVLCPVSPEGGGGGGGAARACKSEWGCIDWGVCQNAEVSLESGVLSGEDYRITSEQCEVDALIPKTCGFQIKNCIDFNYCNNTFTKPEEIQSCFYIENPSCSDNIKNCHDGSCELLVDCGGPCNDCATCSDSIQNQGEQGIDCGGPCPFACPVPETFINKLNKKGIIYSVAFVLIALLIVIIIYVNRVLKIRKGIKQSQTSY